MNALARRQAEAIPARPTDLMPSLPPRVEQLIGERGPLAMDGNFRPTDRTSLPPVRLADTDVRACEDAVQRIDNAMRPADRNELVLELTRLSAHFPASRTETQWRVVIEDYLSELADYPRGAVLDAIRHHKRTGQYFPQLRELLAVCEPGKARLTTTRRRLLTLLHSHRTGQQPYRPAPQLGGMKMIGAAMPNARRTSPAPEKPDTKAEQEAERAEALRLGNGDLAAGYLKMMESA